MPLKGQKKATLFIQVKSKRIYTVYTYTGDEMHLLIDNSSASNAYKYATLDELINNVRRIAKNKGYYTITRYRFEGETWAEIYVNGWIDYCDPYWHKYGFHCEKLG